MPEVGGNVREMKIKTSMDISKFVFALIIFSINTWVLVKPEDVSDSIFGLVQLALWVVGLLLIALSITFKISWGED